MAFGSMDARLTHKWIHVEREITRRDLVRRQADTYMSRVDLPSVSDHPHNRVVSRKATRQQEQGQENISTSLAQANEGGLAGVPRAQSPSKLMFPCSGSRGRVE